jgi:hypothetical protein
MAIFMPLDNNHPHLNFSKIVKLQTPTQIFQNLIHQRKSDESCMSSLNLNDISSYIMTDEKRKSMNDVAMYHNEESNDSELSVGQEKIDDDKSVSNNRMDDDEDSSNASSSQSARLCNNNPKEVSENAIQILRPNPSRIHEEIFRNSQLYAEELVRQQLQLAAAARLQSMSAVKAFPHIDPSAQRLLIDEPSVDPSLTKLNFQSSVFAQTKSIDNNNQNGSNLFCNNNKSAINFQNIHSHLSAISQITNNLTSSIKKDDSTSLSSLSRESSQSPSNFQHLKQHHHQNMLFQTQKNQLHERSDSKLHFSIDNILKADFGRRITEPLLSRKSRKSLRDNKQDKDLFKKFNAPSASMKETFGPRDENPRVPESSPSPSSTEQSSKSESNKSSGTGSGTVWPAWVSCEALLSSRP